MWLGSAAIAAYLKTHSEQPAACVIVAFGLFFSFAIYGDTRNQTP